jgi:nucleoside-diphosphate-sugar epimerase
MPTHLIVGCGYLGMRVANAWMDQGKSVAAVTRSRADFFRSQDIEPIQADVLDRQSLQSLPQVDTVLFAVGMDYRLASQGISMRDVYVQGLKNVLDHLPPPKQLIYISSTSVYGQISVEWVDESSPTKPISASGEVVLEAEAALKSKCAHATILRFAGIYGPDRVLLRKKIEAGEVLSGDPNKWLNLVHVDDGVKAVQAIAEQTVLGEVFLVADGSPVTRGDFYSEMARLLGKPKPQFSGITSSEELANRRIDSKKLYQQLGIEKTFPSYREGLADAIEKSKS